MENNSFLNGFSKLSSEEKLRLISNYFDQPNKVEQEFKDFHHPDEDIQKLLEEFSENTITNFPMPYNIAPNFVINGALYNIPMVTEESSVVAAASKAAKFWSNKGGFHSEIINLEKVGQVHFTFNGDKTILAERFKDLKPLLFKGTEDITYNMRKRGGGILDIELKDLTEEEPNLFQLYVTFDTQDSMGANFINSCLEAFADIFKNWFHDSGHFNSKDQLDIIMCIVSNYTPNCLVRAWVSCDISEFDNKLHGYTGQEFVNKFKTAVRIAEIDTHRATTNNKGIYNGIDAVVLASGNDFRAVEACGHAYASSTGKYSSLTHVKVENNQFTFTLEVPMSLGVVGGLTNLHPLVKRSLELLGQPSAAELMEIAAVVGLANNFGAIASLTTTGIQKGHMKMHLLNILNQFNADDSEKKMVLDYFKDKKVTVSEARRALEMIREKQDSATLIF